MKKSNIFTGILLSSLSVSALASGYVRLFEGSNCSQNSVGEVDLDRYRSINFKDDRYLENDEARSVRLFDIEKGSIIRLYDSPQGRTNDDWISIEARRDISNLCVANLERSTTSSGLRVTYHRNNGLNGKVSHIRVYPATP